jgi:hypothetical protein
VLLAKPLFVSFSIKIESLGLRRLVSVSVVKVAFPSTIKNITSTALG